MKYSSSEPPRFIIDAHLYKLKADVLNWLYEACAGENGALAYDFVLVNDRPVRKTRNFYQSFKKRLAKEIIDDDEFVDQNKVWRKMNPDLSLTKLEMQGIEGKAKETRTKFFEVKDLTLLQFLEHEIV